MYFKPDLEKANIPKKMLRELVKRGQLFPDYARLENGQLVKVYLTKQEKESYEIKKARRK